MSLSSDTRVTPKSPRWRGEAAAVSKTGHAHSYISLSSAAYAVELFIYINAEKRFYF